MSMDEYLYSVKCTPDAESHIKADCEKCKECKSKICTTICPAQVYTWNGEKLIINFENCLECGACRLACEQKCLEWEYPKGTKGVMFKHG